MENHTAIYNSEEEKKKKNEEKLRKQKQSLQLLMKFMKIHYEKNVENEKRNNKKSDEIKFMLFIQQYIDLFDLFSTMLETSYCSMLTFLPEELQTDTELVEQLKESEQICKEHLNLISKKLKSMDNYFNFNIELALGDPDSASGAAFMQINKARIEKQLEDIQNSNNN